MLMFTPHLWKIMEPWFVAWKTSIRVLSVCCPLRIEMYWFHRQNLIGGTLFPMKGTCAIKRYVFIGCRNSLQNYCIMENKKITQCISSIRSSHCLYPSPSLNFQILGYSLSFQLYYEFLFGSLIKLWDIYRRQSQVMPRRMTFWHLSNVCYFIYPSWCFVDGVYMFIWTCWKILC
jgi:hypothetical protein